MDRMMKEVGGNLDRIIALQFLSDGLVLHLSQKSTDSRSPGPAHKGARLTSAPEL